MEIKISDLRAASEAILRHLEETGRDRVVLSLDYYWQIPETELYDLKTQPANFEAGQLSDDWSEIQATLARRRSPVGFDLVYLSAILRAVGQSTVS